MIVDDSFFMRNLLRSILEIEGYTVVAEAGDGEEAVSEFRACRPDLVLMDVIMPVKNGIDATREIIGLDRDVSVVMCSMVGQKRLVRLAREAGALGVILKPFTADDIRVVLENVILEKSKSAKEGICRKTVKRKSMDS
jgi:two-component system chemotaxis response regulator CheY